MTSQNNPKPKNWNLLRPSLFIITIGLALVFQRWINPDANSQLSPSNKKTERVEENNTASLPESSSLQTGQFIKGESFYDIMIAQGVRDKTILEIANASQKIFNLRKVRTGQTYEVHRNADGIPVRIIYQIDRNRELKLFNSSNGWTAEIEKYEYEITEQVSYGTIKDSLYLSLVEVCENPNLAMDLSEIYAWDIDFALDLRKGDRFGILYEKRWHRGKYIGPGRLLAARFVNKGKDYDAVYYSDGMEKGQYYNSEGNSLEKQFLKSPLRFKTVSSQFSRNRIHPILKIKRPHLGVDYAAPHGTPVRSSAEGRIIFIGRKGGLGKMIKIRHNRTYTTAYGHLSRYAKGIKTGHKVKQGDIIAFVGSTGLSTGPHLHYSFYKSGRLVDPMKIKNRRALSISPENLSEFKAKALKYMERINPPYFEELKTAMGVTQN